MVLSNETNNLSKPFTTYQFMLRERLRSIIGPLQLPLKRDVEAALEQRGKLLCPSSNLENPARPNGMWALLPLLIIRDLNPKSDLTAAYNVAIAVECLICALDLLDDIEDGDLTAIVRSIGVARTLNVSTTLLQLAQKSLLSLTGSGISPENIITLTTLLQEATLDAASGQHKDIIGEQQEITLYTSEDCVDIARGKAGSLMRLACVIGCTFVEASQQISLLFAELGELLGIAHQLDNDSHDLYTILHTQEHNLVKTDLERQKKTLPLVLAAQMRASQQIAPDTHQSDKTKLPDKTEPQNVLQKSFDESIIAAWGISLLYRERARDCLQKIESQQLLSPELHLLLGFA